MKIIKSESLAEVLRGWVDYAFETEEPCCKADSKIEVPLSQDRLQSKPLSASGDNLFARAGWNW